MSFKNGLVVTAFVLGLSSTGAAGCDSKQDENAQKRPSTNTMKGPESAKPTPSKTGEVVAKGEMKVLAQGSYGQVESFFVAVVRDADSYVALRALAGGLPELKPDFFRANAVVAAFLGTRATGGFGVEITRAPDGSLKMAEKEPPKDAMTTQALTQPYRIVSVPLSDDEGVRFELPQQSRPNVRSMKVTSGEFDTGGGITGRSEKFAFGGGVRFVRHEKLVTLFFDLKETGGQGRTLVGAATGIVQTNGRFAIASTGAGTFVQTPRSPLRVTGSFTPDESGLTLVFESLPPRVADGFSGGGKLEAKGS